MTQHKTGSPAHLLNSGKRPAQLCLCVSVAHELELAARSGHQQLRSQGEMVQGKRNEAIKRLTEGRVNVLVATDVAARGIDIPDVSHVFILSICRAVAILICTVSDVPRVLVKHTAISLVEAHDHLLLGKFVAI